MPLDPPDLPNLPDERAKSVRGAITAKLSALWKDPKTLSLEVELIAKRGNVSLGGGPRGTDAEDNPARLAAWAVETATDFLLDSGLSQGTEFVLRFGPKSIPFFLFPENDLESTSVTSAFGQMMQHTESNHALYHETTRQMLKTQGEWIGRLADSLAHRDAQMTEFINKQLELARVHAELMDTKYKRDIEMRIEDRKQARYDLGAGKVMQLLEGVGAVAIPKLVEKVDEALGPRDQLDMLAELCTTEEQEILGRLVARVQQRAATRAQQHANGQNAAAKPAE